jgi:anti-sigma-K factor RskA
MSNYHAWIFHHGAYIMKYLTAILLVVAIFVITSCSEDNEAVPPATTLTLSITGLEDLGPSHNYEGWLIVNGTPVSSGTFSVDNTGALSKSSFEVDATDLSTAETFVLTIEPSPDSDPTPSVVHLLAGTFSGNSAELTVGHTAAIGTDFIDVSGSYILATPTNGANTNELSGIWWLVTGSPATPGLSLPPLANGWLYEGWVVIDGIAVSTGTFASHSSADNAAPYSGPQSSPPFPGEDFLINPPAGLHFPVDLSGKKAVISVEPNPDNSAAPFAIKPLVGDIPSDAVVYESNPMTDNVAATLPKGTASR